MVLLDSNKQDEKSFKLHVLVPDEPVCKIQEALCKKLSTMYKRPIRIQAINGINEISDIGRNISAFHLENGTSCLRFLAREYFPLYNHYTIKEDC